MCCHQCLLNTLSYLPKGHKNMEHLGAFPEVFLTVGAPGDNLVIPLSPIPGRPLSLNLNLVPKEDLKSKHCSSNRASPRRTHTRPSTPNKGATSEAHFETLCPPEQRKSMSHLSPEEDCFSLIDKVHTHQLQKGAAPGQKQRKGKGGAKKDKKDSGNK